MSDFKPLATTSPALTLPNTTRTRWTVRLLRIALFVALTAISARLKIVLPGNPVPITAQTFVVLAAGLILGVREGAASQIGYLILIAAGLPIDTNGVGAAAFASPTAGYLVAFVLGAGLAGLGLNRNLPIRIGAAFLGAAAIHLFGTVWLAVYLHSFDKALAADIQFIPVDFGKALLAAVSIYAAGLGVKSMITTRGDHAR